MTQLSFRQRSPARIAGPVAPKVPLANDGTDPVSDGVRDTPVQFDMTGDENRTIVTVDWGSEVICHLVTSPVAPPGDRVRARKNGATCT